MRPLPVALAVIAGLVLAILFVLRKSVGADPRQHARFTNDVRRLAELDARVNQAVLQTRFGLQSHYDTLVAAIDQIDVVSDRLNEDVVWSTDSTRSTVGESISQVREIFREKAELVERYKSQNSILSNSLLYFPGVLGKVLFDDRMAGEAARLVVIEELVVQAIRFALQRSESTGPALLARIESVRGGAAQFESDGGRLDSLLMQTRRVVTNQQVTDERIGLILGLPTSEHLERLEEIALEEYGTLILVAQQQRRSLYGLSLALLIFVLSIGHRLYRTSRELYHANVHLEERIARRTRELSSRNEDLSREVSVRKRAEAQLLRKNRELDEFSYVASHDLQEPLRKLISFSSMLEQDLGSDLPERAAEDVHFITDSATRMQNLVQDLLTLSRAGKKAMASEVIPLAECVDAALLALDTRIGESNAEVRVEGELPEVVGDRTLVTQLYQNLIGNAVKFRRPGERSVVRVGADRRDEGDEVTLFVADNGIGMKPEYLDQIFSPFKRLHGRGEYEGTGIGLSICAKAVDRHGGRIWVESEPGAGTTFLFTLPRAGESSLPVGDDATSGANHA